MSELNDEALRAMVRQSVARALGQRADRFGPPPLAAAVAGHTSHFRYVLPESDGPCLIEPAVPCTHCGYCQSYGH